MSLNIKNAETYRLAHELAEFTGESVTGAVTRSVRERLERVRGGEPGSLASRLLAIGRDCAGRLPEPYRTLDHGELLFGDDGLPQMIIDTSALKAILRDEPDARRFAEAIEAASERRISAATYVEIGAVIDGARDAIASRRVDELIDAANIVVEPVTRQQADVARAAYRDFGKGSGHPAGLNFGDCFAYALASTSGEPLLFKGDDFSRTDITPA